GELAPVPILAASGEGAPTAPPLAPQAPVDPDAVDPDAAAADAPLDGAALEDAGTAAVPPDAAASPAPPEPPAPEPPVLVEPEPAFAPALPDDLIDAPVAGEIIFSDEAEWEVDGVFEPTFEIRTPTASYWVVKPLGTIVSIEDAASGGDQW